MKKEIELKLLFHSKDLSKLKKLPAIRALTSGRPRTRRLVTTYFDTPGRKLHKRMATLRVRKEGGKYIQCIKSGGSKIGGVMVRDERETFIRTETPDISLIHDKSIRKLIRGGGSGKLEPLFKTDFRRTSRKIVFDDGGEASIDIDVGEIVTPTARKPICEMELELVSCSPHHLLQLALEIHEEVPLRLSVTSKAQRGFALLTGEKATWRKDAKIDLSNDASVEDAMIHTIQHCLNHLLDNEACTLESDHPEGVHQMRVALRRLRSALVVFRPVLSPKQYEWANGEVKWLTFQMAATRDLDVFIDEIVAPVEAQSPDDAAFSVMHDRLARAQKQSRLATRKAIRSARYTRFLLQMSAWLAKRSWRDNKDERAMNILSGSLKNLADTLITKRHRKVRKQGEHFWRMSINERHQLRIDVKKLRYTTDFFSSLYPQKKVKPYAARLAKLQDALGYLNDVAVAENLVRQLYRGCKGEEALLCRLAGGIVIGWHLHALAQSESILIEGVRDFMKGKPFWSTD